MDPKRLSKVAVIHAEHGHVGESDQEFTDTDRVRFHRGSPI
jgi:hypothetical protein